MYVYTYIYCIYIYIYIYTHTRTKIHKYTPAAHLDELEDAFRFGQVKRLHRDSLALLRCNSRFVLFAPGKTLLPSPLYPTK